MNRSCEMVALSDVCEKTSNIKWDKADKKKFNYIDLSSVSRDILDITGSIEIDGESAPSRAKKIIKTGDVIFATTRPTLKRVAIVHENYNEQICSTGFTVLRNIKKKIIHSYIFYFLQSNEFMKRVESLQRGASYPAISDNDVKQSILRVPSLEEQKKIVAILDQAFAAIDQAQANIQQNIQNAQDLFQSKLNQVFSQQGEGWEEAKLSDLCSIKHGFAFKSVFFKTSGDYVVLTPGSFYEEGGFRDQGLKTKYYEGEIPEGYILKKGSFLFAMTEQAKGLLGSSLIVMEDDYFLHNQRLGLVELLDGVIWCNDFFFHQFNTKKFRNAVQESASGVKVRHTSPTKLGVINISYPRSFDEQQEIAESLNKLLVKSKAMVFHYELKINELNELKKSLLQKAFNGELTQIQRVA